MFFHIQRLLYSLFFTDKFRMDKVIVFSKTKNKNTIFLFRQHTNFVHFKTWQIHLEKNIKKYIKPPKSFLATVYGKHVEVAGACSVQFRSIVTQPMPGWTRRGGGFKCKTRADSKMIHLNGESSCGTLPTYTEQNFLKLES